MCVTSHIKIRSKYEFLVEIDFKVIIQYWSTIHVPNKAKG